MDCSIGSVMHDSSGISIVESLKPCWSEGYGWILEPNPVVTIGVEDGPDEYSLYQVRDALVLPNGGIVIANEGSDQLRYYSSSGRFRYAVGTDGYGPGEFKMMSKIWLVADTLYVYDFGQDRISFFTSNGAYIRTVMLHREPNSSTPHAIGVFSDGSILAESADMEHRDISDGGFSYRRFVSTYKRHSSDGDLIGSIGSFFNGDAVSEIIETYTIPNDKRVYSKGLVASPPYGRRGSTIAFRNNLYHGSSEFWEIQVFDLVGDLQRIIRRPVPNPPVSSRDKDVFREYWLEDGDDWSRRRVDELEYPDTKPAYGTVLVDQVGNIWVAEYEMRREDRRAMWTVLDSVGRMLGNVSMPKGGVIFEIGNDYVLGVWRTEMDVEQVKKYRIVKE